MIAADWVHRHQLIIIDFLQAENRLLKERLCGKRIWFTDAKRALLARKAKAVGPSTLTDNPPQASDAKCGFACHTVAKKEDYVFTKYPER